MHDSVQISGNIEYRMSPSATQGGHQQFFRCNTHELCENLRPEAVVARKSNDWPSIATTNHAPAASGFYGCQWSMRSELSLIAL